MKTLELVKTKGASPSTVGRGKLKNLEISSSISSFKNDLVSLDCGDSLDFYQRWERPDCIMSDGAYGILGFEGDTSDHLNIASWYSPHIQNWTKYAKPNTTLWFWNSEIGWATVHPILEQNGWRYINANVWNKGKGHIAGNINTSKIRRFPVVTELCVQYVFETRIDGKVLKEWLRGEWVRSGIPMKKANEACGVADAAVRKYLDLSHLWYFPPPEMFEKLVDYANRYGNEHGKPYFSVDKTKPLTKVEWQKMRAHFECPHGFTNVWDRSALRDSERVRMNGVGKAVHLNQKPLDLMKMLIQASTKLNEVIWEPFGGLFSGCLAAQELERRGFGAEIDKTYFNFGVSRFI